jgi:uncharacterized membrane protein
MSHSDPTFGTERLGALSDGVFAIILTLLVLDLKLPELPAGYAEPGMIRALEERIPNLVAWIISFVLVARIWIVHHAIVANLGRCHVRTFVWNFLVLGICSLVPFGAGLIGTYEWDPIAITIFSSIFALTGISLGLFARHAALERDLHHERSSPDSLMRHWRYHASIIPIVALVSIAFIEIAEIVSLGVWIVEPVIAAASERRQRG